MSHLLEFNHGFFADALAGPSINLLGARRQSGASNAVGSGGPGGAKRGRMLAPQLKSRELVKRCILAVGFFVFAATTCSVTASIILTVVSN